ncbi:class I SAM-dependent methyltransferase [Flavobacteriaceae bacterium]|nr:class I SAM-dependent methyltransferase [Flavobacteriaceae bacterium]
MKNNFNEISCCEVCGNKDLKSVLDLGLHPMCDDLVKVGDERICNEYPIEILYCNTCITAHQRFQVPKEDLFPSTYHYRSRFTADVLNGMKSLVSSCEDRFGSLSGKKVLDIGCNDGSLLDFFKEKGAATIGLEPTDAYLDAEVKKHKVYNDYLTVDVADKILSEQGKFDFITFTNVFAHIEDLNAVLDSLKILMTNRTVIIIENHYLGAVLEGNQFDTFYHEHPRTYSYNSFVHIAKKLDFDPIEVEFPSRYGGNIRVFLGDVQIYGQQSKNDLDKLSLREKSFFEKFSRLKINIVDWQLSKKVLLNNLIKDQGPLKAKAFPGRAAILVKMLGLNSNMISEVYEKPGSLKIGFYLPGTRIPIKSDDELFNSADISKPILNLAWHISNEIHDYFIQNGYRGEIIDILERNDFNN